MNKLSQILLSVFAAAGMFAVVNSCASSTNPSGTAPEKSRVGVLLLVHGGSEFTDTTRWDSTLQIFYYDPHSVIYQRVIWNERAWPMILQAGNAPKEEGKYAFEDERIGYNDPSTRYFRSTTDALRRELRKSERELGVEFVVDWVNWIGEIEHLPSPRLIYNGPEGNTTKVTYCGEGLREDGDDGPAWTNCDPQRYNTDGAIDRLLARNVDDIVIVDLTTSGVRFFKSYDVIRTSRELVARHNTANGTDIEVHWVNDPGDLMRRSYPDAPVGWTNSLGEPDNDPSIPLADNPNPVSSDPVFAALHAEGIEARFNPKVPAAKTGVMLVNHATRRYNQLFDPKIDDTIILNENIRNALLADNPDMPRENIVGSWMGIKEFNPEAGKLERTRPMRGENLGHAYLYETDEEFPGDEWGYLYWDALEYLKNQGMEHIVIAFPQITVDSVLNLVELPNQIGKELGYRTWLYIDEPDFSTYPEVGHPFAEYWGIWVDKTCRATPDATEAYECCFTMGGCSDGRPYPPPRQAPPGKARDDLDPSLAFAVSEYGHLGYDPALGAPDPARPVQQQYTGTWATWDPPNDDPRIGRFLADHVVEFLKASE